MSILTTFIALVCAALQFSTQTTQLSEWQFRRDHDYTASDGWQDVRIPHDWAISGPFDRANDLQTVAVIQNGEEVPSIKTGRSGGLPWMGKGCYRTSLEVEPVPGNKYELVFDGAMSQARVLVNGQEAGFWPYGYNAFHFDITPLLQKGRNDITVLLENLPQSSRWYPGAGLYRKVCLRESPQIHIPVWGTYITTPHASKESATVRVQYEIEGMEDGNMITLETVIRDENGLEAARKRETRRIYSSTVTQILEVDSPKLWSPESPSLYTATVTLYTATVTLYTATAATTVYNIAKWRNRTDFQEGTKEVYSSSTRFGIRSIEFRPESGFYLNGERTMFKGVCLHHDLGALGSAFNRSAARHHLLLLKDMGCNAIRTSHNMPAQELVELCDELGFILMVESFDEWNEAKCENGYHIWFDKWAEKDMVNMIRHFRSNPSVVMWSIGNEVPNQWRPEGVLVAKYLQDICHREDPTRPVTCGMDQFDGALECGFAAILDIPGFNYKPYRYLQARHYLPQGFILGSETASTVSSRGVYHFPVQNGYEILNEDHQCSSYDLEYCTWANIPDEDFAADEDYPWMLGQFVWTGFDYLGEPSPYDTDAWPNHSSVFGIIDLASIPKDRFYLYRSVWNTSEPTLHVLPHWTWPGREGEITPVAVYTSWPEAELFVNGVSQGRRSFSKESFTSRHRLTWDSVVYEPGELKVVAYDGNGEIAGTRTIRTAGKAKSLKLQADRTVLEATGEDLAYLTVSAVDAEGNEVPCDNRLVSIEVKGAGSFEAIANGDPCCLESFVEPKMHLFNGKLCFIVRADEAGTIEISAKATGMKKKITEIICKQ